MRSERALGVTRTRDDSRGNSRWSIRNVIPPPQPDVRMRSVGSSTGLRSVTSARPSTGETVTLTTSSSDWMIFSIHR